MSLFHSYPAHKKPIAGRYFAQRFRFARQCMLAFLLCAAPSVLALESEGHGLSLREAVAKSLNSHPDLRSFTYRVRSAEAYARQSAVGEKPEINLTIEDAFGNGEYAAYDSAQTTLSISWLLDGSLLNRRVDTYQTKRDLIEIEREIRSYDIAAETAHDFLSVLAYQEQLVITQKAQAHALITLQNIEYRVKAGKSPLADQLRAEVSLERRELDVEEIHHDLKVAKIKLASQWGSKSATFDRVSGSLILIGQLVDYAELQKAIKINPEIRYFLTKERIADSEITLAKEEVRNRWRFNAGVRRYETTDDYGFVFGVSRPIGKSNRNQGRLSALSAEQDRYRADAQAKEIKLSTRLYTLYEELKHSYHLNEVLMQKIVPRLEQALDETQKAYLSGRYSYLELSVLQNDVLSAHMELINSRLNAHNSTIEIERLTGLIMPKAALKRGDKSQ